MEILYDSTDFAVCVKPVGLDSETEVPRELGGDVFTVHRLDKNVGGVMVYARTKSAAAELSRSIQNGELIKEYLAIVNGHPEESGVFEDLLWKDSAKNKVFVVNRMRNGVKKAKLSYTVVSYFGSTSFVRIRLYTGRSHQIRVQFASRKFPLAGDHKYGARDNETAPKLYSCALTFTFRGKNYHFESKPDWA